VGCIVMPSVGVIVRMSWMSLVCVCVRVVSVFVFIGSCDM